MNTITQTHSTDVKSGNFLLQRLFQKQLESFEKIPYGMMGFYLTLHSCLGGIACMILLQSYVSILVLMPCAMVTMLCNALLISQASNKWSVILFDLSILVNTFYIIAYSF